MENPSNPMQTYQARQLVSPGKYEGFQIMGRFDLNGPPEKVLFLVGGRILDLAPVNARDFEMIAERVGLIDLGNPDRVAAVERAGFFEGQGKMYFSGSEEAAPFENLFVQSEVLPPMALATPLPRLPSSEASLPDPVIVSVRAVVSRAGGLMNVEINEGVNPKLDSIAVQTVQNSWVFLPAISKNEVAQAELKLRVIFQR